jgi:glyoxylase-like metal-dependent hydrolase (beta-lactamase superfamily II)
MECTLSHPFPNDDVNIFAYSYQPVDGRMYVLLTDRECIVVDPANDADAVAMLKSRGMGELKIILTHEHCDHMTGVATLRDNFDCELICTKECADAIPDPRKNFSHFKDFLVMSISERKQESFADDEFCVFTCKADTWFENEFLFAFGNYKIRLVQTPGHSKGSLCMVVNDSNDVPLCLFTGDNLMTDYEISTRLPGGSRKKYEEITLPFLRSFKKDVIVYPGHGTDSLIRDIQS